MQLSAAARSVWAKSIDEDGAWLPLWQHMDDAADIAGGLFDGWLAPSVVRLFADEFEGDIAQARSAVMFLAGAHDLGKATPAFAVQDSTLAQRMTVLGLSVPASKAGLPDRHVAHHTVAGHHLLIRWLTQRGWPKGSARAWGIVLGGHHGVPPDVAAEQGGAPDRTPDNYGSGAWDQARCELLERVAARTGARPMLDRWRAKRLSAQFQVLATAVVIVSDWIASNSDLLPFHRDGSPEVREGADRVARALDALGLPSPWKPEGATLDFADLFTTRFRLPPSASPRPVQVAACEVARTMDAPGLLIIEAPMGEGKTEAALAAAEITAAAWGSGGLFVALPTQATSDAMFERIVAWLDAMGSTGHDVGGSLTLSHGKARFNPLFRGLTRRARFRGIGCDEEEGTTSHAVVAHAWLSGRKKAQLANFAVGTIDQVLFAALKSRHLMLRHLGLAGKVVILDEIHAYDAYMNSYLSRVLTWLGAYRVPVIALSATLPAQRRRDLLEAYARTHPGPAAPIEQADASTYPALTWTTGTSAGRRAVRASGRRTSVRVEPLSDDPEDLVLRLRETLSGGGAALVVRNTVRRVLDTATRLTQEFPGEVTVSHSRFVVADRLRKDAELLDAFGPPGRATSRPARHIVVASQVVEQSLDVDFDLMVTDLAPIDLVLQRMGRLHRHERGVGQSDRPEKLRQARLYVTGADFAQDPPALDPASARFVYGAYPLLRAAAVLRPRFGGTIELPQDIAPLVQAAYGPEAIEPKSWGPAVDAAREDWRTRIAAREAAAEHFQIRDPSTPGKAIVGWVSGSVGDTDDMAQGQGQVRDGEPSLEVLLLCQDPAGQWRTPAWLGAGHGGVPVPQTVAPADELAEVLATCALRLPLTLSDEATERALRVATPAAWQRSPLVYRQPVLVVDGQGYGRINQHRVRYTAQNGLEVLRRAP